YHFEMANVENLFQHFEDASNECKVCLEAGLPLPAYDQCMIASHAFNVLDARKAVSRSLTNRAGRIPTIWAIPSRPRVSAFGGVRSGASFRNCRNGRTRPGTRWQSRRIPG
ncbi:MAG TPA: glycine--tRNA ligase subunit alpha, partial [Anaerolineae bacterium]|nr:glycine--tRNA ligase subunit alpha [Anaerolineae bacterium]